MKVLVTGGAGFIGSHVVDHLIGNGHEVLVVDNLSTGSLKNVSEKARFFELDIRDRGLAGLIDREKPDWISHQAALANVRESFERPLEYADVNVLGSLNLLECCRESGVKKVIYASTGGAVYGEPRYLPVHEGHPVNPLDPYGASKHHVEHYLHLYRANFGLDYTVLRYPNVYGPRQDPLGEAGVVAIFIGQMLRGETPVINGDGEQQRDFVHVADVARANIAALEKGENQILNIGSGVGTSVNTVASLLVDLTGFKKKVEHGPAKPGEVSRIYLDASRAREELGWGVSLDLSEGLEDTVQYFRLLMAAEAES